MTQHLLDQLFRAGSYRLFHFLNLWETLAVIGVIAVILAWRRP